MEKEHSDLYDHVREGLLNELSQLQSLKREGKDVSSLENDIYERLQNYFEAEDARRLTKVRETLNQVNEGISLRTRGRKR